MVFSTLKNIYITENDKILKRLYQIFFTHTMLITTIPQIKNLILSINNNYHKLF